MERLRLRDPLEGVAVFVAVAEVGSFSGAARRLGVSTSAVSQSIRALEERLGTPLFRRSTRSLSLTDVGKDYLRAVSPALAQLRQAAEDATGRGGRPSGPLRITLSRAPFALGMASALASFQNAHPEVELEISVEARLIDIVKEGFDAGLRYGKNLDKDMVAVLVAPSSEALLVASPSYIQAHRMPNSPGDLVHYRAIACRSQGTGMILPWTLQSAGKTVQVSLATTTIVHDLASQIDLAVMGLGIGNIPQGMVSELLDAGRLIRVMPHWRCPVEALYLYYPRARHQSAALRAFVEFVKRRLRSGV